MWQCFSFHSHACYKHEYIQCCPSTQSNWNEIVVYFKVPPVKYTLYYIYVLHVILFLISIMIHLFLRIYTWIRCGIFNEIWVRKGEIQRNPSRLASIKCVPYMSCMLWVRRCFSIKMFHSMTINEDDLPQIRTLTHTHWAI